MIQKTTNCTILFSLMALLSVGSACKGGASGATALIPKDSTLVGGINLGAIRGTSLYKSLMTPEIRKSIEEEEGAALLLDSTESVTIGGNAQTKKGVAVLKGKFDPAAIGAAISAGRAKKGKPKLTEGTHNGVKTFTDEAGATSAFLSGDTLLVGTADWVKLAIDLSKGQGAAVDQNAAVADLVKRAKTGKSLWVAGQVPSEAQQQAAATGIKVTTLVASIDFASGLEVDVAAGTGSDAEAKKAVDMGTTALAAGKKNPMVAMTGFGGIIDAVKLKQEGAEVVVNVNLTQAQLDDLVTRAKAMMGSLGGILGGRKKRPPADRAVVPATPERGVSPAVKVVVPAAPGVKVVAPGAKVVVPAAPPKAAVKPAVKPAAR